VGTGFKAPTFSELLATTAFEVGNPALDPERSRSAEFGLELAGDGFAVQLTAFDQRFEELIQYISASPGEPTYANLGVARAWGVEGSVRVPLAPGASLRLHATWLGTTVTDSGQVSSVVFAQGEALLRRPALSGGMTGSVRLGTLRLAGGATWVGGRDDADFRHFPATRTTLPSYIVVELAAALPLVRSAPGRLGVELSVRGENLFDAEFEQAVGFPGRDRTLFAGGRLSF
jgi:vitamin B12 transporter